MRIAITVGMGHIGHQPASHNGGNNHLKAYSTGTLEQRIFVGIPGLNTPQFLSRYVRDTVLEVAEVL